MKKSCPLCGAEYDSAQTFCSKDGAVLRVDAAVAGDLVGSVIADRYRIVSRLGEGGMGTVFLAEHVKIGRKSAVKVVKPDMAADPDALARFIREATNASKIEHPNVANIHDFGELEDGRLYLAMEFVEGESLAALLHRDGPVAPYRAAQIVTQVAAGLQAAHDLGIVHRDLKPENIMLARHKDGSDKVKLVDFGIAKSHADAGQKVTRTGVLIGTPAYMSPEQVAGGEVNGASDQFALACSTFEMLTGVLPFEGDSTFEQITSRVAGRARALAQVRADIAWAPVLQEVLMKGLAAQPTDRYPSMIAFSAAFAAAVRATPGTAPTIAVPLEGLTPPTVQRPSAKTIVTGPRSATAASVPETRVAAAKTGGSGSGMWFGVAAVVLVAGGLGAWQWTQRPSDADTPASMVTSPPAEVAPTPAPTPAPDSTVAVGVDSTPPAATDTATTQPLKRPVATMPERTPTRTTSKPVEKPSTPSVSTPTLPQAPAPSTIAPAPAPQPEPSTPPPAPKPAPQREPVREPDPEPEEPAPTRPAVRGASAADSVSIAESRARARAAMASGDTVAACRELSGALEKSRGNRRIAALVRLNMQNLKCRP